MKIGFVASAFDLVHPGHMLMLKDAKQHCDYLIVAVQLDPSIERPEKNEPVQSIEERQIMLKGIKYVDEIYVYTTEEELLALLKVLKPDIRIMGTDWKGKPFTGHELKIPIHWHERDVHTFSTTNLRNRIVKVEDLVREQKRGK
jgi:glycerol-3-phosphate cytidylyltransferase